MAKNKAYLFFFLLVITFGATAQTGSIIHRIILIGDAGEQKNGVHPEIEMLKKNFKLDEHTTVVYLGDNIYPRGLPAQEAPNYAGKKQILDSQINIARNTDAKVYFIAGNHDWTQGRKDGCQQIMHQYNYITSLQDANVKYIPANAYPGPEEINISNKITLVAMDSQWWLHKFDKPVRGTEKEILARLDEIIKRNHDKLVIFVAHHPFITFGPHGGHFTFRQHLFPLTDVKPWLYIPLPVIGSIYPLSRKIFGNIQDTKNPKYRKYSSAADSILAQHPHCIRAAGHEHNLQFIEHNNNYYIGSGAGSKQSALKKNPQLLFSSFKTGFAIIEIAGNGNVYVKFYSSKHKDPAEPLFTKVLENYSN